MAKLKVKSSEGVRVFVYGTLKPGEANYQKYCAGKLVDAQKATVGGQLFALPMGYPAMTAGDSKVHGYLFSFTNPEILNQLDLLEDYSPTRETSDNLYNRQIIEVYDPKGLSIGWVWSYLMTLEQVNKLGGVPQPDGWWSCSG